ncbi:MAG TPA: cyclopropane-fatty-acyl-phospholipid synthase family protein [Euzebya sp.]|nr:cyclopropane-fatty-acyl-phospholipid synthase family protein [Euzebya sp.]
MRRLHTLVADGRLPVRLWDGSMLGPSDPPYRLVLTSPTAVRALLPPSDLRSGRAYIDGLIDIDGDAVAALSAVWDLDLVGGLRRRQLARAADLLRLPAPEADGDVGRPVLSGRPHSRARDADAVRFHYDVGNDFFRLFLDRDLVYSCAYFLHPDDTLEVAQRRKLDIICRKLRLRPGERLLDVGCGWGSLAIHAAREYGVGVVGVTLAPQQAELAAQRVAQAGLSDQVEIRLQDYREVTGHFDAIASVGMVEHVGPTHMPGYFATLRNLLADGGRLLNHGITTGRRLQVTDYSRGPANFVSTYVFPDGGLVPTWHVVREVEQAGLEVRDLEQMRPSYALTLRQWVRRLEARWEEAVGLVGERTARVWRVYMAGSAANFEHGHLDVVQVLGVTPGAHGPLGRDWMMPPAAPSTP